MCPGLDSFASDNQFTAPPDFDLLIEKLRLLNGRFMLSGKTDELDQLIRDGIRGLHEFDLIQDNPTARITLGGTAGHSYILHFDIKNESVVFSRIVIILEDKSKTGQQEMKS
jgi:hypothetical protein